MKTVSISPHNEVKTLPKEMRSLANTSHPEKDEQTYQASELNSFGGSMNLKGGCRNLPPDRFCARRECSRQRDTPEE
jgi:hypothetical protein